MSNHICTDCRRMTVPSLHARPHDDARKLHTGFGLGAPLEGGAIGRVEASACEEFAPGNLVQSMLGWREAFHAPPAALTKGAAITLPPEALLGVSSLPELTAWTRW